MAVLSLPSQLPRLLSYAALIFNTSSRRALESREPHLGREIDRMMALMGLAGRCGCGGIGRRPGFRFQCRKAWGFESLHPHQSSHRHYFSFLLRKNSPWRADAPVLAASFEYRRRVSRPGNAHRFTRAGGFPFSGRTVSEPEHPCGGPGGQPVSFRDETAGIEIAAWSKPAASR